MKSSEKEMGEFLIPWLNEQGWDVYPEVEIFRGGPVADIVGKRGNFLWAIEMKKSLSLDVINQADYWIRYANFSSVFVPTIGSGWSKKRQFAKKILSLTGIGLLEMRSGYGVTPVQETVTPIFRRKVDSRLMNTLNEGHKAMGVAGSNKGERWTPFKESVSAMKDYLKTNPGSSYEELISGIKHHWKTPSSARQCIKNYLDSGIIKGILVNKDQKKHRLYLEN